MTSLGNKEILSKNLKYYIERSGKDRRELAETWGFPYSTVTDWINGKKYPRIDRIEVMADYFGVSIDRLFGYHMNSYAEEVKAIIKAADDSMDTYKEIEIISEGLSKYPNSPDLKIYLAFSL